MNRAERRIIAARIRRRLNRLFERSAFLDARNYRKLRCNEGKKYNWLHRGPYFDRYDYADMKRERLRHEKLWQAREYRLWLNGDFED